MFPIRDHNPSETTPFITYALIAVNVVAFLAELPFMADDYALSAFFDSWAMQPAEVFAGQAPHTVITSMFLHAGIMHIAGNMLFLWIFGDNLEDQMGHLGFLAFYLATGIAAALVHIGSDPTSMIPTVGASGAIAGRSLWKDCLLGDREVTARQLRDVAVPRLREVQAVLVETLA
jgi:membrane associated rhomboid family serine protease